LKIATAAPALVRGPSNLSERSVDFQPGSMVLNSGLMGLAAGLKK